MSIPLILEDGLYQYLLAQTTITALVGPSGIFMNTVTENAHDPAICFSKISSQPDSTNDGPSGLNFRRYQFESYSSSFVKCLQVDAAVRIALDGFSGFLPNGQRVYNIMRDNEIDGFDDISGNSRTITDYFIHFAE